LHRPAPLRLGSGAASRYLLFRMARFVDLIAIEGPDKGMRFAIEEGTYRVLVRVQDEQQSTVQMTDGGDRALDKQQESVVDEHLGRRSRGGRMHMKRRGPDIVLHDGSVSRTHALVFVDAESASVVDLMSTNGTKVNGGPIKDTELREGDVVHLGKTKLRVEAG
jgi:pSer/pThr/pTyr-binding forkhead associated (FHA) protein